ncbi:MAG: hypothetical protein DMF78_18980 [Acidobacteria bacterium]|nr:MAG: hypothetical protein DMF78_18980 [Acidobacteriota bacterium]
MAAARRAAPGRSGGRDPGQRRAELRGRGGGRERAGLGARVRPRGRGDAQGVGAAGSEPGRRPRALPLQVPGLPRQEVDPTGAGDVFATAFLVRYQETGDPSQAAVFAACAASCVVEGLAATSLGDRAEVTKRIAQRERLIEDGEWEE